MAPERLGRFEIIREIGRGAMGLVYLAQDPRLQRNVAVKTFETTGGLPADEQEAFRERFLREARAAARLQHSNIMTVYDAGEDGSPAVPWMAMEYIDGVGLDSFTRKPDLLPVKRVVALMVQAAEALDYAHRNKLVHRDIKPANLMLVGGQTLKITDFGLAKAPESSLTTDGTIIGTPNYMSPEQIAGRTLDGRSDLFSLGVVLYELLAGEKPFPGDTISTVMYRILHEEPREIHEITPDIPAPLAHLIIRLLSKDREHRPARGKEVADALRAAEQGGPVATTTGAPRQVTGGFADLALPGSQRNGSGEADNDSPLAPARPAADRRSRHVSKVFGIGVALLLGAVGIGYMFFQEEIMSGVRRALGSPDAPLVAGNPARGESGNATDAPAGTPDGVGPERPGREGVPAGGVPGGGLPPGVPSEVDGLRVIRVTTEPAGAELSVDGRPIDSDLLRLEIDDGPRVIRAEKGCLVAEARVDPAAAEDELALELRPGPPVDVMVRTEPKGASIHLDGKSTRRKTPAEVSVDPCAGSTLTLKRSGYATGSLSLPSDVGPEALRASVETVKLERLPDGTLVIEKGSIPLTVRMGKRRLGSSGQKLTLRPGRHRLTLVNDDLFLSKTVEVSIPSGESVRVDPAIPAPGRLSVQAYPSNCKVYVARAGQGPARYVDDVPMLDHPLAPGSYTVRVEFSATGEIQEKTVEIRPGRSASLPFRFGT